MSTQKIVGLFAGLFLGFVWVIWEFSDAVLVALVGLVGYLIGAVLSGELDLLNGLRRLQSRR